MVTEFMNKKYLVQAAILIVVIIGFVFLGIGDKCKNTENEIGYNGTNVPGYLVIHFKSNVTQATMKTVIERHGLTFLESFKNIAYVGSVPIGKERFWMCVLFQQESGVIEIVKPGARTISLSWKKSITS